MFSTRLALSSRPQVSAAIAGILLFGASEVATHVVWAGIEVTENGVLYVRNDETPRDGTTQVTLNELWSVGGADDEETLIGVVSNLVEDSDGNIYVLDSQLSEIQVFGPDGEALRTIGRSGEGPGEFQNGTDLYLGPEDLIGVVQVFPGKIVRMGLDGTPASNFPLPASGGFQIAHRVRANEGMVVIAGAINEGSGAESGQRTYLKAFDPDGKEIAHFYDELHPMKFGGMEFQEREFSNFSRRWAMAKDGRVAAALDFDDYRVHIWNPDGSVNRIIERPAHRPVDRSKKDRARFQTMFDAATSWNPGSTFKISDSHVTVNRLSFREDGSLWVLASSGIFEVGEGVFTAFDVYDVDGNYVKRVEILGDHSPTEDGIFFAGERVIVVTELFSAQMASLGGGEAEEEGEEPEPIAVIAYTME